MKRTAYIISIFCILNISAGEWQTMQQEYLALRSNLADLPEKYKHQYLHPYWQQEVQNMASLILGREDHNFLNKGPLAGPMVRKVWCKTQDYEVVCLQKCIKDETRKLLSRYVDTPFGGVKMDCREFNYSINGLGQVFFLAKILERNPISKINTIVELGGGYGSLARVARMVLPDLTYIIIDLPEYLAIQSYYLRSTLPNTKVKMLKGSNDSIEAGAVNLVPVYYIEKFDITADIFISTAALSETPAYLQKLIVEKKFFDAFSTYLTGQLDRWGSQHNFEHHSILLDGMRSCYDLCFCQPLHHFGGELNCYEMYGTSIVK